MLLVAAAAALAVLAARAQGQGVQDSRVPAQAATGTAKPSTQEPCTLSGVVVNATTGLPLKRAFVNLEQKFASRDALLNVGGDPRQRRTRTDASGRFAFSGLDAGQYYLSADHPGFLARAYGQESQDGPAKNLGLKAGDHKEGIVIRLTATGVITGHVFDEDGDPLPGAAVQAMEWHYLNGRRQLQPVASAASNDIGEYRLIGLRAQPYYVAAVYNDWNQGETDDGPSQSYVPAYYPSTPDPAGAQPVEVRAGDETPSIDLSLTPVPAVRIRGQLTGQVPIGRRDVGFNVSLVRPEAGIYSYQQAQINPTDGTFEIPDVPPGSYVLNCQIWDRGTSYFARQRVEVGNSNLDGVNLVVGPGATIRGLIHAEGKLDLKLNGLQVNLVPRDLMQPGVPPAAAGADGSFVLKQVPGGPYDVQVCCLPPEGYLKAARLGSADALDRGLIVRQGDTGGSLELVLGGAAGQVNGVVTRDHKPFANATVVLVPDSNHRDRTWLYKVVNSAQDGSFSVQGIPPGDYELFAWEKVEYGAWQDPDFLLPIEDKATPVRIAEGSKLRVEVQEIPAQTP